VGIIILAKNIFHKLRYANIWIYSTTGEILTIIICQGKRESHILKIKQQGLMKLSQESRAYAEDIILSPTRAIKSKFYVNFILQIGTGKLSITLPGQIKNMDMPNIKGKYDLHKLDNVNEIAHLLDELGQGMINDEILRQSGYAVNNESHTYLIYAIIGLLVFTTMLL